MSKMKRNISFFIGVLILAGFVFIMIWAIQFFHQKPISTISERAIGNPKAPIKIVEFIDFQCEPCALGSQYLSQLMRDYPGSVLLVAKYFPLGKHAHAMMSAHYAECAARQKKFWPFHDLLFQRQEEWSSSENAAEIFNQMAREIKLDLEALGACVSDQSVKQVIANDKKSGKLIEVIATPTYFVNERKVVGKANLEPELNRLIQRISADVTAAR